MNKKWSDSLIEKLMAYIVIDVYCVNNYTEGWCVTKVSDAEISRSNYVIKCNVVSVITYKQNEKKKVYIK